MEKVCIVLLPAYNEEKSIGKVIDEITALPYKYGILVVDNNSKNGTAEIIRKAVIEKGIQTIFVEEQGKGHAVQKALMFIDGPMILMDSDFTYPACYIPALVEGLERYDVVIGYRKKKDKDSMTLTNKVGNYLLTKLANLLYGTHIHDVCSGMWAFRDARPLVVESTGFTLEAEFLIQSSRYKWKIGEIPIHYRAREDKPKLRVIDGFRIGAYLIRERLR